MLLVSGLCLYKLVNSIPPVTQSPLVHVIGRRKGAYPTGYRSYNVLQKKSYYQNVDVIGTTNISSAVLPRNASVNGCEWTARSLKSRELVLPLIIKRIRYQGLDILLKSTIYNLATPERSSTRFCRTKSSLI
jgi:hypothetical protein